MSFLSLPDMDFCRRMGWVQFTSQARDWRITLAGKPRKIRRHRLTATEYTRERRARLYAAGLTGRGTPRKK